MKKYLFFFLFLFVSHLGFSQKGLSYQAVILDPAKIEIPGQDISGQPLVNGDVWLKFSIYNGSTLQFEEVHKTKTDNYGLVNLLIGSVSSASFNALVWDSSQKSLYVYVSFNQGGSYTKISDQKLNYNPYALFAETAGKLSSVLPIANGGTGATTAADARTNLGLDQVNNSSDAAKPISTATKAALDLKANATDVTAGLALKANTSDVNAALAAKADTGTIKLYVESTLASGTFTTTQGSNTTISDADSNTKGKIQLAGDLGGTADAPTVPGLIMKANAEDMISGLALKANAAEVTAALALKLNSSEKGVANGIATLNASGIIPSNQLPPVTISSTSVVESEAAMVALSSATVGSIAIRTDVYKNYVLSALPSSTLANWIELLTPGAPVQTVNGYIGSVNLVKSDIGLANVDNTSDVNKQVSSATQTALNLKADTATVRTALALKLSIIDANAALNLKLDANKLGVANGTASLNASGKIPTDQIPAISFSSVKVLSSQADMLALSTAVVGSVVIRTDINKNYVLAQANPSILANWIELLTPAPPVQSVNGYTGSISLTASDLGLGNVTNTSDANKPISTATQTALDGKAASADLATTATAVSALTTQVNSQSSSLTGLAKVARTGDYNDLVHIPTQVASNNLSGTVSITNGGTGATTAAGAIANLGAENTSNRSTSIQADASSTTKYPSVKLIKDYVDGLTSNANLTGDVISTGNASTVQKINGTSLAGLATGLLKNTTSTGVPTIAIAGTDYQAPLTLTTTGSGAATLSGTTLNIPSVSTSVSASNLSGTVSGANGGTGVDNTGKTITLGGNLVTSSALTFTASGATNLTLPASGTLATVQQLDSKAPLASPALTGTPTAPTASSTDNSTKIATTAFVQAVNATNANLTGDVTSTGNAATVQKINGTSLSGLATGLLKNTTSTGVPTIAIAGTDFQAPLTLTTTGSGAATLSGTTLNIPSSISSVTAGSISGTIAIANGGTGATTKSSAFDALSPMSTSGDLIYGGTNGSGTRLGKGTNGMILTMDNNTPQWLSSIRATAGSTYNAAVGFAFIGGDWAKNTGMFSDNPDAGDAMLKFRITGNPKLTIDPNQVNIVPTTVATSKTTGALTVAGGLGVNGDIYASSLKVTSLEVNGASTNSSAYNAGSGTTIDFTKSNLAYTSSSAATFTLSGMKDGGTYTLAVQGGTSGTAAFTATGFTLKSVNNGATSASKETLYTFIVMGTTVYYSMMTGL